MSLIFYIILEIIGTSLWAPERVWEKMIIKKPQQILLAEALVNKSY
jgi:hypothetical protein